MRRLNRVLLFALPLILVIALAAGCAASREAVRPDASKAEFRPPAAEGLDVRLLEETVPQPPGTPPLSVSDESQGRWLTLFQIDVTPSEAAGIPKEPAVDSP